MILYGSRSDNTYDEFSDWDYRITNHDDLSVLDIMIENSSSWNVHKINNTWLLTVIDANGQMFDYLDDKSIMPSSYWENKIAKSDDRAMDEYWINSIKVLKGMFREYDVLVDIGLELLCDNARSLILSQKAGIINYKTFFSYKKQHKVIEDIMADSSKVLRLPYRSNIEKLEKIDRINELLAGINPRPSDKKLAAYNVAKSKLGNLSG